MIVNNYQFPPELTASNSWCVWRVEYRDNGDPTKVPYNPVTGFGARSNDPTTWVAYSVAVAAMATGAWSGLGYFLNDDFVFIDLDNPYALKNDGTPKHKDPAKIAAIQQEVAQRFGATYAEVSPSGTGLHIVARGLLPSGRRRNAIEMYSNGRFMTMTGNVYAANPIVDCQEQITWLYNEMGGDAEVITTFQGEYEDKVSDQTVVDKAMNAQNGVKFRDLAQGNWQQYYGSQSEADFALIDILAYYTKSVWQIARIFRASALGQRDKAARDNYVLPMIQRSFDRMPPPLDIDAMANALNAQFGDLLRPAGTSVGAAPRGPTVPQQGASASGNPARDSTGIVAPDAANVGIAFDDESSNPYRRPVPGLLGQIAYYIYEQSPRPVPEISLAGAIGLMSGICGRAFNVSGTGLNQYTMLLAQTGRGKEAINAGIAKLMDKVADIDHGGCPGAYEFVGPSTIASGQALLKHLDKTSKSFVSVMGEVDSTLKSMTARNANAGLLMLKQMMLRAYSASGRGENLGSMIYSDKDKNTSSISSPAFSVIGEGTPGKFYEMLDESLVSDGLLPRFTIIEYNGDRVPTNRARENVKPSPQLVSAVANLCAYALHLNQKNEPVNVGMTPEADAYFHQFDLTVDAIMNKANGNEVINQLWNRAHLKAMKLAALVAVGINMTNPVIDFAAAEYAVTLVKRDTSRLVAKFNAGDIGEGISKQLSDMRKAIRAVLSYTPDQFGKAGGTWEMQRDRVLPRRALQQRTTNVASYKNAREGYARAFESVIRELIDTNIIAQVGATDLQRYGKNTGKFYIVTDPHWLNE